MSAIDELVDLILARSPKMRPNLDMALAGIVAGRGVVPLPL